MRVRVDGWGPMVGKVVVIFDRVQGRGLAEETQMMDWNEFGQQGLKRWRSSVRRVSGASLRGKSLPSSMPRPERRTGTRTT